MSNKVLVVLTSHDTLGDTGKETGFYLPEVSHPVEVFDRVGLTVEYVSPKGDWGRSG
jgi:putative intracellular protease/amidase